MHHPGLTTRRTFLSSSAALLGATALGREHEQPDRKKALIAITLDLEMSAEYPRRGITEWNYQKGNLDDATKKYAVEAGRIVKERGGVLHYFCVGQVLEHPSVDWLKELSAAGHPIGNHTYDHVYVKANKPDELQFRFRRAPWLIRGRGVRDVIVENIRMTTAGLKERAGITVNGFRTPGGFYNGLTDRPDVQKLLLDLGFTWISSLYPAHKTGEPKKEPGADVYADIVKAQEKAQPFVYPSGLIEVPMSPISDVGAFRSNFWKLDYFLKAIRQGVEWAIANSAVFDFLAHPSCLVVEDPKFETIKLICDLVRRAGDRAALVGLDTIAKRVEKKRSGG
jgi:peptidoglycan/xylan/chitin deacetylase (PgdA/CDA1 family)